MGGIRSAIVGCGNIAGLLDGMPHIRAAYRVATHAAAYKAHPAFELAGACDPSQDARDGFGRLWKGVPLYSDTAGMLAAVRPDMVSIATPVSCREEVFKAIVAVGGIRLVLCEKPLAATAQAAERCVRLCAGAGIPLVVNYLRRFDVGHARARDVLVNGGLGEVRSASLVYSDGVRNTATHLLDFATWCFGAPVVARATAQRESLPGVSVLDGQVAYVSGVVATLSGVGGPGVRVATCDVYGTRGRIVIDREGFRLRRYRLAPHERVAGRLQLEHKPEELPATIGEAMLGVMEACARTLEQGVQAPCTGEDGVAVLRVVEAMERSLNSDGAWVPCGGPGDGDVSLPLGLACDDATQEHGTE